jgi:stage II sporulation protein D
MRSGDRERHGWVAGVAIATALTIVWTTGTRESVQAVRIASRETGGDVRIGVLGLFRPQELRLSPAGNSGLEVALDGRSRWVARDAQAVVIRLDGKQLAVQFETNSGVISGGILRASGRFGANLGGFWLEVPGKLKRRYGGTLEIHAHAAQLEAVVTMPLETAVASVVAAESPPGAGLEALKAQAVAARSFLVARQAGHADFDFCDTTHCQFLRSPPEPGSAPDKAARATRGLVLEWHDDTGRNRPLAALYARSCGGRTRTLREAGVHSDGYPYYAVRCEYCSRHPEVWQREAKGAPRTEQERLAFNRIHGWGAVPSLPAGETGSDGQIQGRGVGHGIGLCQLGAAEMARQRATFAQILAHYYPNTKLTQLESP